MKCFGGFVQKRRDSCVSATGMNLGSDISILGSKEALEGHRGFSWDINFVGDINVYVAVDRPLRRTH